MTFLTAMVYALLFILIISLFGLLFLFLDWIGKNHPLIGISILLIGGFLLMSFGVWTFGNL